MFRRTGDTARGTLLTCAVNTVKEGVVVKDNRKTNVAVKDDKLFEGLLWRN